MKRDKNIKIKNIFKGEKNMANSVQVTKVWTEFINKSEKYKNFKCK